MPITKYLERNAELYGNDCALVELNPEVKETMRITWKEYDLTQPEPNLPYRREISWYIFNEKANRCAHYLLERGVRKGDKVGILMMNCLEWLPIYFGILKTGAYSATGHGGVYCGFVCIYAAAIRTKQQFCCHEARKSLDIYNWCDL